MFALYNVNPIDIILEFSDDPPIIVVLSPETNLFPTKSIVPRNWYVILSTRFIIPPVGDGRFDILSTKTKFVKEECISPASPVSPLRP